MIMILAQVHYGDAIVEAKKSQFSEAICCAYVAYAGHLVRSSNYIRWLRHA